MDLSQLDDDAVRATQRLIKQGYEAYLVGGCVRDLLLGREPKDYDIATEARPQQVKRVFPRNCRIIGRRFKLAHLHFHGNTKILECSTFRRTPQQGENGDDVLITRDNEFGTAEEDALRRDFTVNALFLDPTRDTILDYTNGLQDLHARVIRTIGDPRVRFREDPVRILRAAKFASRLGFTVEPDTFAAMCETSVDLMRSAPPRVLEEILRLLRSGHALDSFQLLRDVGAVKCLVPVVAEFLADADHDQRVDFWRLLEALDRHVQDGHTPQNGVLLSTLMVGPVLAKVARNPGRSPSSIAEELLGPFCAALRLPRRDAGCVKRVCGVQHRFGQTDEEKRFRTEGFLHGPYFLEALELFELRTLAAGADLRVVDRWKDLAGDAFGENGDHRRDAAFDEQDGDAEDGEARDAIRDVLPDDVGADVPARRPFGRGQTGDRRPGGRGHDRGASEPGTADRAPHGGAARADRPDAGRNAADRGGRGDGDANRARGPLRPRDDADADGDAPAGSLRNRGALRDDVDPDGDASASSLRGRGTSRDDGDAFAGAVPPPDDREPADDAAELADGDTPSSNPWEQQSDPGRRKRRRRRRRGRGGRGDDAEAAAPADREPGAPAARTPFGGADDPAPDDGDADAGDRRAPAEPAGDDAFAPPVRSLRRRAPAAFDDGDDADAPLSVRTPHELPEFIAPEHVEDDTDVDVDAAADGAAGDERAPVPGGRGRDRADHHAPRGRDGERVRDAAGPAGAADDGDDARDDAPEAGADTSTGDDGEQGPRRRRRRRRRRRGGGGGEPFPASQAPAPHGEALAHTRHEPPADDDVVRDPGAPVRDFDDAEFADGDGASRRDDGGIAGDERDLDRDAAPGGDGSGAGDPGPAGEDGPRRRRRRRRGRGRGRRGDGAGIDARRDGAPGADDPLAPQRAHDGHEPGDDDDDRNPDEPLGAEQRPRDARGEHATDAPDRVARGEPGDAVEHDGLDERDAGEPERTDHGPRGEPARDPAGSGRGRRSQRGERGDGGGRPHHPQRGQGQQPQRGQPQRAEQQARSQRQGGGSPQPQREQQARQRGGHQQPNDRQRAHGAPSQRQGQPGNRQRDERGDRQGGNQRHGGDQRPGGDARQGGNGQGNDRGGRRGRDRGRDRGRGSPRDVDVVPRHRDRRGRVEVIEPAALDLSAFDVELDPKRVPTFGSIVEGKGRPKRRSPRVPDDGVDDYKPPPPPGSSGGPAPPPPPPTNEPDDTFGDW